MEEDNIDLKFETQKNLNQADELKRTAADAKQLRDSRITYEVSNQLITITPNDIQQVNQHLKEADKIYQNMTAKNQIKSTYLLERNRFAEASPPLTIAHFGVYTT